MATAHPPPSPEAVPTKTHYRPRSRPSRSRLPRSRPPPVPASSVPRSPLQKARSPDEKEAPRRTCSDWSCRNGKTPLVGMSGSADREQPATAQLSASAVWPRHVSALPLALPGQPGSEARRTRPARMRPSRSTAQLPFRRAGNLWTCRLLLQVRGRLRWSAARLPDLFVARTEWSSSPPNRLACYTLGTGCELGRPSLSGGDNSPVAYSSWPRGPGPRRRRPGQFPTPAVRPRRWCKEPRRPADSGQPFISRSRCSILNVPPAAAGDGPGRPGATEPLGGAPDSVQRAGRSSRRGTAE